MMLLLSSYSLTKAQSQSPDTTARYFLIHASIGNLQEIASGKLAMQQGTTPEIKAFGKMMVADHSKAEMQLLELAKMQNIPLPDAATAMPVADLNLKKAQGKVFDHLYVHAMEPAHRQTLLQFKDYALTGKNAAVKAFAQQMLSTLKAHLAAIVAIDQEMNRSPVYVIYQLTVSSLAFEKNGMIPAKYSCQGAGISPPLTITNIPNGTQSLAIIIHDPDAPHPGGVTHWVAWNLPLDGNIPENFKGGDQGRNSDHQNGYKAICPPDGTHHYNFMVYALDRKLALDRSTDEEGLKNAIQGHLLAQGELTGLYRESK